MINAQKQRFFTIHELADDRRASRRIACQIRGRIITGSGEFPCTINDISAGGVRFGVYMFPLLSIPQKISVYCSEFGSVSGEVRWAENPNYGLKIAAPHRKFVNYYQSLMEGAGRAGSGR